MRYDFIDERLKELGMSRTQMAKKAGISAGVISTAFMRKSKTLSRDKVEKIASVLGVRWYDLYDTEDDKEMDSLSKKDIDDIADDIAKRYMETTGNYINSIRKAILLLNDEGRKEAVKRVNELTEIKRYRKDEQP